MQPDKRLTALAIAVWGALYAAAPALGQDNEAALEQVVVTGSRIKRPEYEGNIPGVQVSSKEIEERSFTNLIDVLQDIPLVGTGPPTIELNVPSPLFR